MEACILKFSFYKYYLIVLPAFFLIVTIFTTPSPTSASMRTFLPAKRPKLLQAPKLKANNLLTNYIAVKLICDDRVKVCRTKMKLVVCAMKLKNNTKYYKDYDSPCLHMLDNICDNLGDEYHILSSGSCEQYLKQRRSFERANTTTDKNIDSQATTDQNYNAGNSTDKYFDKTTDYDESSTEKYDGNNTDSDYDSDSNDDFSSTTDAMVTHSALRRGTIIDVDGEKVPVFKESEYSFDGHKCPRYCPDIYEPLCLIANEFLGVDYTAMYFVNHCELDKFYCLNHVKMNWTEDNVDTSGITWVKCAAYSFVQYGRFSEAVSALGHYGWLEGDMRYSTILTKSEKIALTGVQRYKHIYNFG